MYLVKWPEREYSSVFPGFQAVEDVFIFLLTSQVKESQFKATLQKLLQNLSPSVGRVST